MKYSLISLLGFILLISFSFYGCKKADDDVKDLKIFKVAGLLPQSGALSNLGITSRFALELGVTDVNNDFISRGLPYRIELSLYDSQLDTNVAKSLMQASASNGYRMFIGPWTSSELNAIKPLADSLGLLVVSPGSTSRSLVIPNDAIFRYCPGEEIVGTALSNSMYNAGKRAAVSFSRNDIATLGLQATFDSIFTSLGGVAVSAGSYPVSTTDFTQIINDVRNQIISMSASYPLNEICVFYPSFNEAILLFNQASGDPVLTSVDWFGGVGFIKAPGLLSDTAAAEFALATNFFSPETALPNSAQSIWQPLKAEIEIQSGLEADFYAFAAYDALKVMSKLFEINQGSMPAGSLLQMGFYNLSNQSNGATGPLSLDLAGDRSTGVFNYWGLVNNNGVYEWTIVGQSQ